MIAKAGRFGPYVQLGEIDEGSKEQAARRRRCSRRWRSTRSRSRTRCGCCRCPASSGVDPADGDEITAQNGRYGPYIKKGTDSRSLESEEQLFTITLDEALELLAAAQASAGPERVTPPLRELGADPVSEKPVVVKEGRFGPYVTDGETNASLRKGDEADDAHHRARRRAAPEPA